MKREMQIRHSRPYQRINLWPIENRLSDAVRESLRIGSNPIVLFRIKRGSGVDAEFLLEAFYDLSNFLSQGMLHALRGGGENIAEGPRLALIRPEAIWSVHRVHEYCGEIWILYARQHRCDCSPHSRLNRGNHPERHRPLEVPALMCDFAGPLRITCQRRRVDNVPSLLKFRQKLIMRS